MKGHIYRAVKKPGILGGATQERSAREIRLARARAVVAANQDRLSHQTVLQSGSVSAKTRSHYLKLLALLDNTPLLANENMESEEG